MNGVGVFHMIGYGHSLAVVKVKVKVCLTSVSGQCSRWMGRIGVVVSCGRLGGAKGHQISKPPCFLWHGEVRCWDKTGSHTKVHRASTLACVGSAGMRLSWRHNVVVDLQSDR
jgi:hypothetical protein